MEAAQTFQIIDAIELASGSPERYNLKNDRILGRSNQNETAIADGLMDNDIVSGLGIAQGKKGKKSKSLRLRGTEGSDVLEGGKGNDNIYGEGGDDVLLGGKGNDFIVGGGRSGDFDQMTGGKGKDKFSLVHQGFFVGYLGDDVLESGSANRGFAVIHDFKLGEDRIMLFSVPEHYILIPVFWEQSFGSVEKIDTAIVYVGPGQDELDVVGVLKDVARSSLSLKTRMFEFVN